MANEQITFDKLPQAVGYLTEQMEQIRQRSGDAATLACAVGDRATKPAACKAVTDRRYRRNWRVPF